MEKFNFQVNLGGMIDILANHLYSEEKVFIRELLQNAVDAITARKQLEPGFEGSVHIDLVAGDATTPPQIIFEDTGVGLTKEEIHVFLSSIGSSSKRKAEKLSDTRENFIGQFGIGLLSCFMITDEIVMVTRSAKSGEVHEWRGNSDGSYSTKKLNIELESGTRVYLRAKAGVDKFFKKDYLKELIFHFGNLLPFPIYFGENRQQINEGHAPFDSPNTSKIDLLSFGKKHFELEFFDCFPIQTDSGGTKGVAFILPFSPNPSVKMTHKVYLKNMLISDNVDNILPRWAFFVKCIINSNNLRPTASRESFYEDENLKLTQEELGECIKNYLIDLALNNPSKLQQLIRIHHDTLKALALYDDDFFKIIIHHLPFSSNIGHVTLPEFEKESPEIQYIPDIDEFRQVAGVASAQGISIINAGYVFDKDLLRKYAKLNEKKVVKQLTAQDFIQNFEDLTIEERNESHDFLQYAKEILREFKCDATLKKFKPENVPTLYYMNAKMNFLRSAEKTKDIGDEIWGSILESVTEDLKYQTGAQLCFNYNHPLVKRLAENTSQDLNELYIKILFVQALLLGHHPLNNKEMNILSGGLMTLLEWSMPNNKGLRKNKSSN